MLEKITNVLILLDEKISALLTLIEYTAQRLEPLPIAPKRLLCAKDAAERLGVTQRTLYKYGMLGIVQYEVISGRKYYVETSVKCIVPGSIGEKRK